MDTSLDELQAWIGRSETVRDQIGATPVKALNATLDHPSTDASSGTPLPPLPERWPAAIRRRSATSFPSSPSRICRRSGSTWRSG